MNPQSRTYLFLLLTISILTSLLIGITFWLDAIFSPYPRMLVKGIHENAVLAASQVCPMSECDVQLGWSTKLLSNSGSAPVFQRWCVEALFKRDETGENGRAAVDVILIDRDNDNPENWRVVAIMPRADCRAIK